MVGFVLRSQEVDVASSLRQRYMATESQWDTALEDWERRCGIDRIEGLKGSLIEAKRSFEGLAGEEREKVSKYQADRRQRQLTSYLERFRIRNVKISGIGQAKEAALASYGIETAADVEIRQGACRSRLWTGQFASAASSGGKGWKKFVYDPKPNAVDHAVLGKIRAETARKAAQLRQQLASGAKELWKAVHACEQMRKDPDPLLSRLEAAARADQSGFCLSRHSAAATASTASATETPTPSASFRYLRTTTTRVQNGAAGATPSCPSCGRSMVKRTARRGRRRGSQFWGCSQYPRCRGTRPI